jgi:hypothetical protein
VLSGTPSQEDVGSYRVNVTVHDVRGGWDSREFDLIVAEVNDPPSWLNVPDDSSLLEGEKYRFDVNASDPDPDDELSFGIASSPGSNISIDLVTGEIEWIAGIEPFVTGPYILNVDLSVSDGKITIYHSFELKVIPLPVPRVKLISPDNEEKVSYQNITLEWELSFLPQDQGEIGYLVYFSTWEFTLKDPSSSENVLIINGSTTYSIEDLSPGDTIHWTVVPRTEKTTGKCIDRIRAFRINNPPTIQPVENRSVEAGEELRLSLTGFDEDEEDRDDLEFSILLAPEDLYIDRATGFIIWTTMSDDLGNHSISVELSDGLDTAEITFNVEVKAPEVDPEPEKKDSNLLLIFLVLISIGIAVLIGSLLYFRDRKNKIDDSYGEHKAVKEEE